MAKPPESGRTARRTAKKNSTSDTSATVGYEAELWRMADALRGSMDAAEYKHVVQIAHGDTFHNDRFPDLKADLILANSPVNVSDWGGERLRDDTRWRYGAPPAGNAHFYWVQHSVHHFAPTESPGTIPVQSLMKCHG